MKYTVEGFSQRAAMSFKKEVIKNGKKTVLKLDVTDLVILRWFVDFFPKMKKYTEGDVQYAWVHYETVLEDIPLLQIGKIPLYRRLQKMVSLGILTHKHIKVNGSFSYYGFGENYMRLLDDEVDTPHEQSSPPPVTFESHPYDSKVTPPMTLKSYPLELQSHTKDSSTINSSTINSKKESKEKKMERSYRFTPPSVEEVREHCEKRNNGIDAEQFVAFYASKGWKVGNQPMKDWKSAVITWEIRRKNERKSKPKKLCTESQSFTTEDLRYNIFDDEEFENEESSYTTPIGSPRTNNDFQLGKVET